MSEEYTPAVESAAIDADELMAKYDKESAYRRLTGFPSKLVFFLCVAWSVFQLYTGLFGTFPSTLQRAPHLAAAMTLVYLLYPIAGKSTKPTSHIPIYDYALALASVGVGPLPCDLLRRPAAARRFVYADGHHRQLRCDPPAAGGCAPCGRHGRGQHRLCVPALRIFRTSDPENALPLPRKIYIQARGLHGMAEHGGHPRLPDLRFLDVYLPVHGICDLPQGQRRRRLDDRPCHRDLRRQHRAVRPRRPLWPALCRERSAALPWPMWSLPVRSPFR